jgi:hypothetical protein
MLAIQEYIHVRNPRVKTVNAGIEKPLHQEIPKEISIMSTRKRVTLVLP